MTTHAAASTGGGGAGQPAPSAIVPTLAEAVGPGYRGEWALFCDYTSATGQPALPTTVAALTGFLTALPARPQTLARRVRAIVAAHGRAGQLLERPDAGPASPPGRRLPKTDPGPMIAGCPTRGWPQGLHGRRDAFLVVLTSSLELPPPRARSLTPAAVTFDASGEPLPGVDGKVLSIAGQPVPSDADPRSCAVCAVVRWLDILGILDGLGRGSARMDLVAAHAATLDTSHSHRPRVPHRWRDAATLLPAIDQHGWLDDFRPITTRTIRARLAHTAARNLLERPQPVRPDAPSPTERPAGPRFGPTEPTLDEVLSVLDGVADDADALNTRIQALLDNDR